MIIGIDLGTTNSACSIWINGKSELIPNRLGDFLTPSVVGVDDDDSILVGEIAKNRLISHPQMTTSVFKRYMGTDYEITLGSKRYTAYELSALILKNLKEDAEAHLNTSITEAVISVPAYFNDKQRQATKSAGELAGLNVSRLINEPTAAAMVYGLHNREENSKFIILDLGGGTFDVSLVEYFEGILEVHASSGDNHLGGEEFLEIMSCQYFNETGLNRNKLKPTELNAVLKQLEEAKKALSTDHSVIIDKAIPGQNQPWEIDRDKFEKMSQHLLNRIRLPIERTISDAEIHPTEIDEVILVGGATRMPCIKSLIAKMFRCLPASYIDPDLVVAMGAGIQAGLRARNEDLDDVVLTDVSPYSLGIAIINDSDKKGDEGNIYSPIIERNNTVPISMESIFYTTQDNQKEIEVNVFQGESRLVKNNVFLGSLSLQVPKAPKGQSSIIVRFSYDMNGLLEVDVTVSQTGENHHKSILSSGESISDKELLASRNRLAKLKFHPRNSEGNRLLLSRSDRMYETSLGERRDYIMLIISQFTATLDSQKSREITLAALQFKERLDELEGENLFE